MCPDEAQVQDMFKTVVATFGTLDILVNNAGLQRDAPFAQMTLAQWNTVIGVNLTGQFLCGARSDPVNSRAAASIAQSPWPPARSSA